MFNTAKKQIPTCPSIKQSPKQNAKFKVNLPPLFVLETEEWQRIILNMIDH